MLGSCKTSRLNQIYIVPISHHTELIAQKKTRRKYNAHRVGVIVSDKCKVVESRQLHIHSTCVLNDTERCRVIQTCLLQAKGLKLKEAIKFHEAGCYLLVNLAP